MKAEANAEIYMENYFEESFIKSNATAYCLQGTTASGQKVRKGICAGKDEWMGKTILVYQRLDGDELGDLIGIFECLDKGGTDAIKKGYVIDVWQPTYEECQEFMNLVYSNGCHGRIYIQIVEAYG